MPTVSTFFGIDIIMRFSEKHGPHFHARYAGNEALISILNGKVLAGQWSPPRASARSGMARAASR